MAGGPPLSLTAVSPSSPGETSPSYTAPLLVLTSLFFAWGFLTCLNDILIPHLKAIFALSYAQAMMIQFAFFAAYFIMSLPAGSIVKKAGYKNGIIIGLCTVGIGCMLFYPAASIRSYPTFLLALLVLASGITLLQVAANPFVAILGRPETASSRLTLTQAFNSLGTTVAPIFGSLLILSTAATSPAEVAAMSAAEAQAYRLQEAASVQRPYLGLAAALLLLAACIALFKLPKISAPADSPADDAAGRLASGGSAWRYPHLVLGAVGIFVYVGAEVAIGSFLISYLKEPYILGLDESAAARYVSFYWGAAMVGRFVGIVTLRLYRPASVLAFHAAAAALLVVITMTTKGSIAAWAILAVGLFNSIMFPTIFTMAIDRLGKHTSQGSGILCMAIVGGAVLPVLQGLLADQIGIHHAFVIPVFCYAYIAWYALKGQRIRG